MGVEALTVLMRSLSSRRRAHVVVTGLAFALMYTTLIQVSATDHPEPALRGIDHVQLAMPPRWRGPGARSSTPACSGSRRSPSRRRWPPGAGAGSRTAPVRVHLGVEDDFRPARKAHPALRRRRAAGVRRRRRARLHVGGRHPGTSSAATSTTRSATASSSSMGSGYPTRSERKRARPLMRRIRYQEIADDLRAAGHGGAGRVAAAQRVGAVGPSSAPAGSPSAGRSSWSATMG